MSVQKLRFGATFHFALLGVAYDDPEVLVSAALLPNADTNPEAYTANPFGCVIDGQVTKKYIEETDTCFKAGRYVEQINKRLVAAMIDLSLREQSPILHRLGWDVSAPVADGVPQTPFIGADYVEGWAHLEWKADDALPRYTGAFWCKMRPKEDTKWSKDSTKPAISLEIDITNVLNTVLFDNISA